MKSKLLVYAAVGVGGYLLYKAYKKGMAGNNLQYSVKQVRYNGSSLTQSNFELDLNVLNTSTESLTFSRFFGNLKYNNDTVALLNLDGAGKNITINQMGTTVVTVPVTINHLQAVQGVIAIVKKILERQPVNGLVLDGTLSAGPLAVPIIQNLSFLFSNNTPQQVSGPDCFTCIGTGVLN